MARKDIAFPTVPALGRAGAVKASKHIDCLKNLEFYRRVSRTVCFFVFFTLTILHKVTEIKGLNVVFLNDIHLTYLFRTGLKGP